MGISVEVDLLLFDQLYTAFIILSIIVFFVHWGIHYLLLWLYPHTKQVGYKFVIT